MLSSEAEGYGVVVSGWNLQEKKRLKKEKKKAKKEEQRGREGGRSASPSSSSDPDAGDYAQVRCKPALTSAHGMAPASIPSQLENTLYADVRD
jgi:hypothetical protein